MIGQITEVDGVPTRYHDCLNMVYNKVRTAKNYRTLENDATTHPKTKSKQSKTTRQQLITARQQPTMMPQQLDMMSRQSNTMPPQY